jgi:gliding motility-associated-like protein
VCMEIKINDFLDIVTLQFSINWDPSVLKYEGTQNYNLENFNGSNVAGPEAPLNDPGQATVLWFDPTTLGVTLDNGTSIFEICFLVVGDCDATTGISFTSDPLPIEVSNETEVVDVSTVTGDFTAVCGNCDPGVSNVINPSCPGDSDGSIDIQVAGCPTPVTFDWSTGEKTEDISGLKAGEYSVTITTGDNDVIVLDMIVLSDPDPISASASISDVQGGGDGSIDLTVNGGTPPYSFVWSHGPTTEDVSDLDPGDYSVTITDTNGCQFVAGPYTVRDGSSEIVGDITDVICFGGSTGAINIVGVNCGPGPYTYIWSNDATSENISDLAVGTYTVTVTTNNGNTCEASFDVGGPDSAIEITADTTNETGAGGNGAIVLTVTGGQGPYTYIWSTGETTKDISGLTSESYTVSVTDQLGCVAVETIAIRGKELFIDFVVSDHNGFGVSCFGECDGDLIADVSNGIGDLDYEWSNGETSPILTDLCGGSYTLTVTDDIGQTAEASVILTEPERLETEADVTCASDPGIADGAAIARVFGGVPPYNYEWSTGATSTSISDQKAGPFVLIVTDDNNCQNMLQSEICLDGIACYEAITVITPNGDGKNDEFMIQCIFELPNHLVIYNRYGGKEFEVDNYNNSWQGTDNAGNDLSDGGYHWVLEVFLDNGDLRVFNGTVSILRSLD